MSLLDRQPRRSKKILEPGQHRTTGVSTTLTRATHSARNHHLDKSKTHDNRRHARHQHQLTQQPQQTQQQNVQLPSVSLVGSTHPANTNANTIANNSNSNLAGNPLSLTGVSVNNPANLNANTNENSSTNSNLNSAKSNSNLSSNSNASSNSKILNTDINIKIAGNGGGDASDEEEDDDIDKEKQMLDKDTEMSTNTILTQFSHDHTMQMQLNHNHNNNNDNNNNNNNSNNSNNDDIHTGYQNIDQSSESQESSVNTGITHQKTDHSRHGGSTMDGAMTPLSRRFCTPFSQPLLTNGEYFSEGSPFVPPMTTNLFNSSNTDAVYNQLKTHTELAMRAAQEASDRRKSEISRQRSDYNTKLKDTERNYHEDISKLKEKQRCEMSTTMKEYNKRIRDLEVDLAERVASQKALEKSTKDTIVSLKSQLAEKNQRLDKLDVEAHDLTQRCQQLLSQKQELEHEHTSLNEQVQKIKSMWMGVGVGSSKKRKYNHMQ